MRFLHFNLPQACHERKYFVKRNFADMVVGVAHLELSFSTANHLDLFVNYFFCWLAGWLTKRLSFSDGMVADYRLPQMYSFFNKRVYLLALRNLPRVPTPHITARVYFSS